MKNFEFCTQDTSDDIAIGFVFLTVNILSFFSVVVLFEIDINLFFALLGIQFLSIAGWKFKKFHKISKWKRVPIVIQHSNILIEQTYSDTGHIKCFLPQIQYQYDVNGNIYESEKVSLDNKGITVVNRDNAEEIITSIKEKCLAYYNPSKPEESVIFNTIARQRLSHYYALATIGLLLIIVTIGLTFMESNKSAEPINASRAFIGSL